MSDLFAADLTRILWRGMTRAIAGFGILISLVLGVINFVHSVKHPFETHTNLRSAVVTATIPLAFASYLIGASAIGADYTSRALTTLLTWEPRRRLVLASRAGASALVTAGLTLVMLLVLIAALVPSAVVHGAGGGLDGAWYVSISMMLLRCVLFAAAMSILGVSAAAIGRSTTAAVIGIVLYFAVIENAAMQTPSIGRWLLITDAISWIGKNSHTTAGSPDGHTIVTGGLLLVVGMAAICALAVRTFERRDVT